MEEVLIFSEKVAVRLVPRPTFVDPASGVGGVVLETWGLTVSTVTVREFEKPEVFPAASLALALYV